MDEMEGTMGTYSRPIQRDKMKDKQGVEWVPLEGTVYAPCIIKVVLK